MDLLRELLQENEDKTSKAAKPAAKRKGSGKKAREIMDNTFTLTDNDEKKLVKQVKKSSKAK